LRNRFRAFTIIELIITVIIVGILATVGVGQYTGTREQAVRREAMSNLALIASAEKYLSLQADTYKNYTNTSEVNSNLRLSLPLNSPNWNYKVVDANTTAFTAKAGRVKDNNATAWCINATSREAFTAGCVW
jgi:prepilin-type N-terminal cleavage/methylation domain-containing protein